MRLLRLALPVATLLLALFVVASTLLFLAESRWAGPVSDFWLFVPKLAAYEEKGQLWSIAWESYGGHRLFFPKLFYLLEYGLFGGRNQFLVGCNLAFQTLTAALLVGFSWRRGGGLAPTERAFLAATSVLLLFSGTQLVNFSRGWNLHHFMACFALVASLLALARACEADAIRAWRWLGVSLAGAVFGSYSMAIALPIWPVLLLMGWRGRLARAQQLTVASVAAVTLGLFFNGHRAARVGAAERRLDDIPAALHWAAACLGGPLAWSHEELGLALVAAALAGVGAAAVALLISGRKLRGTEILYFGLVFVGAGAALLAAYGRVAGHAENWNAHRYQSFTLLFWLGVVGVGTLASAGEGWRRGLRVVLAACFACWAVAGLLPAHLREGRAVRDFAARVRASHDALLVGVPSRKAYTDSLPKILWRESKPDLAAFSRPWLASRELGMFAEGRQRRLGLDIAKDFRPAPSDACEGGIGNLRFLGGAPALDGHVRGGREILISDAQGRVRGLGRVRSTRFFGPELEFEGWSGWMEPVARDSVVEVWTLLEDGSVCRIDGPRPLQERGGKSGPKRGAGR